MKPIIADLHDDKGGAQPTASALGITAKAGAPVPALCRKLVKAGYDPATPLEAYRNRVMAMTVRSIGDEKHAGMFRVRMPDRSLSDILNRTRANDLFRNIAEAGATQAKAA
jgi:hypothetical protein